MCTRQVLSGFHLTVTWSNKGKITGTFVLGHKRSLTFPFHLRQSDPIIHPFRAWLAQIKLNLGAVILEAAMLAYKDTAGGRLLILDWFIAEQHVQKKKLVDRVTVEQYIYITAVHTEFSNAANKTPQRVWKKKKTTMYFCAQNCKRAGLQH